LNFAGRAQRCAPDFSIFHFPKFQNDWRLGSIFSPAKNRSVEGVSMSGFERLDRLSLPRRTRRRA